MNDFELQLGEYLPAIRSALEDELGDWVVKGFIDIHHNVYTISIDTKVVSKLLELMLFPLIAGFAQRHGYSLHIAEHQNHYPDITLASKDGSRIALDLKSTYRMSEYRASGFTLGSFTGYFRARDFAKNISFPYSEYASHYVLGIVYSRRASAIDEQTMYRLNELRNIQSVASDFVFLLQEKWKIASDKPGSGNTKNIGSVKNIDDLRDGSGTFASAGVDVFDHYWMNYLTRDMARAIDSPVPYTNLEEYWQWREGR